MATQAVTNPVPVADLRRRPGRSASLRRIARKKPVGAIAAVICLLLILIAISADLLAPQGANQIDPLKNPRLLSPSLSHPFGTDNLFRDVFTRIVIGSRISLGVGFTAVFIGTVIGASLGIVSGYFRGKTDLVVSRAMEVVLGFPPLVLAIFILAIFNTSKGYSFRSFLLLSFAIGVIIAPTTARIVRGSALTIRNLQYVEAAESIGNTSFGIMRRHVLPNVVAPIIVIASIQIGNAILAEAALSFLGLGISDAYHPSWGTMLQEGRPVWLEAWWMSVIPGAAIAFAVLSFNLFGDALRDVLDPRLRQSS
ncbi:MAG: ABC transporter permease [Dehalococcoidia bacterium]|uniref:ABC transporter permease n=1 Tax=Candidatus Amarobacter glycogenicus TaxID=3140699 RepID=UPI0031358F1A|nr:ABC transporter permease [Dehalococcoidia bacterium]MBK6562220.1 ABC transporter permease [Dehalococcoidia bacterium]